MENNHERQRVRILIVHNLKSGSGTDEIYDFIRSFVSDNDEVVLRTTDGITNLTTLVEDAHDFDCVVASGGDGTIGIVSYAMRDCQVPLLVHPSGTANLTALNLDNGNEAPTLARTVREGVGVPFDLGEITFTTKDQQKETVGFVLNCGAGYDARIIKDSEPYKNALGSFAYFASALANPNPTTAHFKITVDDEVHELDGIAVMAINFARMTFDIPIVSEGSPNDGILELIVIKPGRTVQLLPTVITAILDRDGKFPLRPQFEVFSGREIKVESDPAINVQYDGDLASGTTPFTVRALENSVKFLVNETSPYYPSSLKAENEKQ